MDDAKSTPDALSKVDIKQIIAEVTQAVMKSLSPGKERQVAVPKKAIEAAIHLEAVGDLAEDDNDKKKEKDEKYESKENVKKSLMKDVAEHNKRYVIMILTFFRKMDIDDTNDEPKKRKKGKKKT